MQSSFGNFLTTRDEVWVDVGVITWPVHKLKFKVRTDRPWGVANFRCLEPYKWRILNPRPSQSIICCVESLSCISSDPHQSLPWILSPALLYPTQTFKSCQTKTSWSFRAFFVLNLKRVQSNNVHLSSFSSSLSLVPSSATLQQRLT